MDTVNTEGSSPDRGTPAELMQYFITELGLLHERAALQEELRANKTNFLLALTTALVGVLVVVSQNTQVMTYLVPLAFIGSAVVLLLGLTTFRQSLDLAANSIWYYRRTGRIRKWVTEQYPTAAAYMPFRIGDDTPQFFVPYAQWRNVDEILVALNAVAAGSAMFFAALIATAVVHVGSIVVPVALAAIPACLAAMVTWVLHIRYARNFLLQREANEAAKGHVHFPVASFAFNRPTMSE
jgi:hypothetical protein